MTLTDKEFEQRKQDIIEGEKQSELSWWYLSFANETGFLGGCFVQAHGFLTAIEKANKLNINPHNCQVKGYPLTENPYPELVDKLLSKEILEGLE